ncbi:hypothetical protein COY16_05065 [Candidatus Roizmanbacteria bacterium CG_4_10_14_0_2_um_filter_39_13]|uniref:YYY membrane protein n=1 Tax=Candidatus Roizmanbacteria bacterium CG_4_10_14_0_2_um_filter_39_13 TaxID=1974825 RepID=A0A2M7TWJ4_9BACT|nr:MAG: hypothetical protein COY16_05065 [Candidatus Roizmanbacteria bacterium CG_4_10_14_0_2_um_filter_39_13]
MMWLTTLSVWYLYLLLLGVIFIPITARIFKSFPDKGYPFAKTLGIIGVSYTMYLLGLLKILPFTKESLFLILFFISFCIYKLFGKEITTLKQLTKKQILLIVFEELLFIASLIFLAIVRAQEPSIHGLEKFMDFGFMESILKSTSFPPLDMWLSADPAHPAGYPINYYYFGHLSGALLTKLSGINPFITYNYILATIFAQGMTLTFSLTGAIAHHIRNQSQKIKKLALLPVMAVGLLGSFIVNLGGNLHTIYTFTRGYPNEHPEPFWSLFQTVAEVRETMASTGGGVYESMVQNSSYWYPNATRFIPFTIHEFPAYSYVVADLHGHVFDIPFVLVTLAFIVTFTLHKLEKESETKHHTLILWIEGFTKHYFGKFSKFLPFKEKGVLSLDMKERIWVVMIGAMIAINYMTNAFDGPIYLLFAAILLLFIYKFSWKFIIQSATILASFLIFSFPFSSHFEPFATGIGVNCSPDFLVQIEKFGPFLFEKGNCQLSEPWMMMVLWGFFWINAILFGTYLYLKKRSQYVLTSVDWILVLIFGYGTLILVIPEFIYAKDIYPGHFRANTMFKLGYQAFMMMGVTSTIVAYLLVRWQSRKKFILLPFFLLSFGLIFIYPFLAFPSYYPGLYLKQTYVKNQNLDGLLWMEKQYPEDKEIIDFINKNIIGQPIILEAQGDSYTDYNRVSAFTGNPTVAGWWVHQWLWRGSSDVVGVRIPDIEALYQSEDILLTQQLIDKYNIEYVVVSGLEREKYEGLKEEKFAQIGYKIFESSNGFGALYKVY